MVDGLVPASEIDIRFSQIRMCFDQNEMGPIQCINQYLWKSELVHPDVQSIFIDIVLLVLLDLLLLAGTIFRDRLLIDMLVKHFKFFKQVETEGLFSFGI